MADPQQNSANLCLLSQPKWCVRISLPYILIFDVHAMTHHYQLCCFACHCSSYLHQANKPGNKCSHIQQATANTHNIRPTCMTGHLTIEVASIFANEA